VRGLLPGDPAKDNRVGEAAAVFGQMAPDGSGGAGREQPWDRLAAGAQDPRQGVASRAA